MKVSDTNQQIDVNSKLSIAESPERLAGRKKIEQSRNYDTITELAAVKTDAVQLSHESQVLANFVKADSDNKVATIQDVGNENALVELLKKADKQSRVFGS